MRPLNGRCKGGRFASSKTGALFDSSPWVRFELTISRTRSNTIASRINPPKNELASQAEVGTGQQVRLKWGQVNSAARVRAIDRITPATDSIND